MDEQDIIETPQEDIAEDNEVMLDEGEVVQETPEEQPQDDKPIDVESIKIEVREKARQEEIDYGEDVDPDDVQVISKVVEKQTASVRQALQDAQDQTEINNYIKDNPEMEKYKPVIEKYLKHPVYSQIPVKNIGAMIASDDLLKIGAKKEREAQARADATRQTGTQVRTPQGGKKDWTKVSKDEFEAQKRRILGQQM